MSAIALTILISQGILQYYISQQESDSIEVNLSGRQRMLSQKIVKAAMLLSDSKEQEEERYRTELARSLEEWTKAHEALQVGNDEMRLKGISDAAILALFSQIQPHFDAMVSGATALLDADLQGHAAAAALILILEHEGPFLEGMDRLVGEIDRLAQAKVSRLRRIELTLLGLALFLVFLELRFIFLPSAQLIKNTFNVLAEKEARSRKMILEISALYESLEKSYLELAESEVELEDLTMYAQCTPSGDFSYFSDKFCEVMTFGDGKPGNLFSWLENQGYSSKFIQEVKDSVLGGNVWDRDLKLVNEDGDFVWLKLHLVPVLDKESQVESLLLISVNETELKEAQVRSQEIHKEKLDKRLKEQQYRSALILEGQEEERRRISRDLHDGIGQYLSALKYSLDGIKEVKTPHEERRLKVSKKLLGDLIKEVRRISFHLTPVALSDYGLAAVLGKFAEEMSKISKIPVVFENQTSFLSRLEVQTENNVYRIVQEAVNNAIKYSEATQIVVRLAHNPKFLNLEISDDGKGFDYSKLTEEGHFKASGHGIFNIKERVNFINGQFALETTPGKGTRIQIELPIDHK